MVEIFGEMRKQSGSTKGALKALAGSLLGPGALIAGLSVIITFAPEIISFFRSLAGGAKVSKEELKRLNDETERLINLQHQALGTFADDKVEMWSEMLKAASTDTNKLGSTLTNLVFEQAKLTKQVERDQEILKKNKKPNEDQLKRMNVRAERLKKLTKLVGLYSAKLDALEKAKIRFDKGQGATGTGKGKKGTGYSALSEEAALDLELEDALAGLEDGEFEAKLNNIADKAYNAASGIKAISMAAREADEATLGFGETSKTTTDQLEIGWNSVAGAIGATVAAAAGGGQSFGQIAGALLKSVGGALISIGVAAVAAGKALAIFGIGVPSIAAGYYAIGIGAALIAGGSALGKSSSGGSGGGSTSSSSVSGSSAPDLRSLQGSGSSGRNVGGYSTRDGNIVISADLIRQSTQASGRKYGSLGG